MIVKLLTEHHLEFLSLKETTEVRLSLHLSKCHIVGNLMHWPICYLKNENFFLPVDRTLLVARIINFIWDAYRTEELWNYFSLCQFGQTKLSFFLHNTAPFIHPRPDMN